MKKELTLILTFFLLSLPIITAPGTDHETPESVVESITLEANGSKISWEANGTSVGGFKVTWSKNENPTYPTREGDKYHYHSDPNENEDTLTDFNGEGEYYVRICEYLGGQCGTYSNQVKTWLGKGETPEPSVEAIILEADGSEISWATNGNSAGGFKVTWSKNENPTYPTREGDKYHYHSDPNKNEDTLTAFAGEGKYYVRVCEYLGGQCGTYSNQVKTWIGGEEEKSWEEEKKESKEEESKENHSTTPEEPTPCNGCLLNEICYPLGHRINKTYCGNDLNMTAQLEEDSICENNFECKSNVCVSGECISSGFIKKIVAWLKAFFG